MLADVIEKLAAGGVVEPAKLQGCTDSEIAALEAEYGLTLPRAYREFLASMGKSAGEFLCGTDFLYADLPPLLENAYDLLSEDEAPLALDIDDFVFAMHQGYTFLFFRCGSSDDPPVFRYEENVPQFERWPKASRAGSPQPRRMRSSLRKRFARADPELQV